MKYVFASRWLDSVSNKHCQPIVSSRENPHYQKLKLHEIKAKKKRKRGISCLVLIFTTADRETTGIAVAVTDGHSGWCWSRDSGQRESWSMWARSYACCIFSQVSGLLPNALDRRMAISGEMAPRQLMTRESVLRWTPRISAASCMLNPRASMQSYLTERPGWGGFSSSCVYS